MTLSELHTVMTNGFATVAGSTLAVYILYGVSPLQAIPEEFSMHRSQLDAYTSGKHVCEINTPLYLTFYIVKLG